MCEAPARGLASAPDPSPRICDAANFLTAASRAQRAACGYQTVQSSDRLQVTNPSRPMEVRMARTTRRTVLQAAALSPLLAAPFVRGAHAAGKLSVGFWDHWVP